MAGNAWDGGSIAPVYSELTGFVLLPRLAESPYDESSYRIDSSLKMARLRGTFNPLALDIPARPFSGRQRILAQSLSSSRLRAIKAPKGIGSNTFMTNDGGVLKLYAFSFETGVLWCELLDTISVSFGGAWAANTFINDNGAFGYVTDGPSTQSVKLYRPGQGKLTVHESAFHSLCWL